MAELPPYHGGAEGRLRRPGGAGATGGDGLSHASRYRACHVARVPRRRRGVPCDETEGEVGGTPGMPAGRTGSAGMVEGGACPDHTRICLRIAPKRGAGDVVGRSRGKSATMSRERHHERGGLRAGTRRCGRGATTRAPSVPTSRSPGGTSGGSPTGAAQGSGNAPDGARRQRPPARRGNAAVVTGPYGASLKSLATPGDLYCVLTWNSVPGSRTLNLDGMRTVVARKPIRVDSQMPRVPS